MSENKFADTSALGLFIVAIALLVFGFVGVLTYAKSEFASIGLMLGPMAWYASIMFLLIAIAQFMAGSKFMTVIFGFLAFTFAVFSKAAEWFPFGAATDGVFLFYILIGVFFILFALWTYLAKAGYMLMGILLMAGLAFLMYALALNADDGLIFFLLMGLFSFVGGILAIYLAIVDTTGLKLPVM